MPLCQISYETMEETMKVIRFERQRRDYRMLLTCLDPAESRSGWGKENDCPWDEEDCDMVRMLADFDRKATSIQRLWRKSLEELPMACPCAEEV